MTYPEKMLKKLVFKISQENQKVGAQNIPSPIEFSFIYGIATDGLGDFEMAVSALQLTESIELTLEPGKARSYLGPAYASLCRQIDFRNFVEPQTLRFELTACTEPEPREIVSAIAELQKEGGCSSSCDCGCH